MSRVHLATWVDRLFWIWRAIITPRQMKKLARWQFLNELMAALPGHRVTVKALTADLLYSYDI